MKKLPGVLFALVGILATSAAYTAPSARTVPSCTKVTVTSTITVAASAT
jgi:hypothetical protein